MSQELQTRTITAAALVLIIGAAIFLGGLYFWACCLLLSTLFFREYAKMYDHKKSRAFFFSTGLIGILYYAGLYLRWNHILEICLLLLLLFGAYRVVTDYPQYTYKNIKTTIFGFLYCYMFVSSLFILRGEPDGLNWILFILLASSLGDVGAYLVGKKFGKSKIAPVLSPNKSLEGLVGGLFFSGVGGMLFGSLVLKIPVPASILLSIAIVFIGLMGDLFESHLKREANIKDTGKSLPGHGGFLDRFDAIIFISGFVYLLLSIRY